MSELYERLQAALGSIAATSANFDLNPESGDVFITFTVSQLPGQGADDTQQGVAMVTVYFSCPLEYDPLAKRSAIMEALKPISDTLVREDEQCNAAGQCYAYSLQVVL